MSDQPMATLEEFTNPETGELERRIVPPVDTYTAAIEAQKSHTLSLEEIEAVDDILEARVYIPEWQGSVVIRQFSKDTELTLRKQATVGGEVDRGQLEMLIIANSLIEPAVTVEQLPILRAKSQRAVDRILQKAVALNATSAEAADKATAEFHQER